MTQQVYQHPGPETIEELSSRVENAWKNFNVKTLKKLIHEIPFRIKAIIQNEGKRIEGPFGHCECEICLS